MWTQLLICPLAKPDVSDGWTRAVAYEIAAFCARLRRYTPKPVFTPEYSIIIQSRFLSCEEKINVNCRRPYSCIFQSSRP